MGVWLAVTSLTEWPGRRRARSCEIFAEFLNFSSNCDFTYQLCQPKEWHLFNLLTMKLFIQLTLFGMAFSRPQVLKSQLPSEPIEDPDLWAWGQHPNGLGYKAPNDLLFETCLSTPNSPLCYEAATSRQCWENASILRTCMCARHTPTTECTNVGAPVRGKVTE